MERDFGNKAYESTVTRVYEEYIEASKPKDNFWERLV
jgi:hypothetical protein